MALTYGNSGLVTSWTGTYNTYLIESARNSPASFTFTAVGDAFDTTRFTSTAPLAAFKRNTKGLRSISGTIRVFIAATPRVGSCGLVTNLLNMATGGTVYDTFLNEYNISIKAGMTDTTRFSSTSSCPEWREFTPGIVDWSGSARGFLDDAVALPGPAQDNQPNATSSNFATFALGASKALAGSVITTNVSTDVNPSNIIPVSFDFVGDGYLQTTGASTTELWVVDASPSSPTVTTPVAGTLTLQTDTGQTYSGSAFWTGIDIKCKVDEIIEMNINWQGTGAWTGFTGV